MKQLKITLSVIALLSFVSALELQGKAIIPTSPGQIGINPVNPVITVITAANAVIIDTKATGDPKANIGGIGVNSDLLTEDGGTTKWIGQNTAYLTELIRTTTVSGAKTEITRVPTMQILGPVDSDGIPTGAFDFLVSPMLLSQIQDLADNYCIDEKTCSADFPPRLEALLKGGGDTLTKRGGVDTAVAISVGVVAASPRLQRFISNVVISIWQMAFGRQQIPHVIHVNPTQEATASPTQMRSTVFSMTVKVMPTGEAVSNENENENDNDECWKYVGIDVRPEDSETLDESSDIEEGTTFNKRSIAGRVLLDSNFSLFSPGLVKRAGEEKNIEKIGKCTDKTATDIIKAMRFPRVSKAMQPFDKQANGPTDDFKTGLDPSLYWFVPHQDVGDFSNVCVIATLTQKGKRNPNNPSFKSDNYPLPYDQSTSVRTLSVDHIWESSTLGDFFDSVLKDEKDPRCKAFIEMFNKPDGGLQVETKSRFFSLWSQQSNAIPGNWALAGVDQRVNNVKGFLLNPHLRSFPPAKEFAGDQTDHEFDQLFQLWNNAGLSMALINHPNIASYFSARNAAIYAAFRDFDAIQQCEKDPEDKTPSTSWAEEFKKYMVNLLEENQGLVRLRIVNLEKRIERQGKKMVDPITNRPNRYARALVSLQTTYSVDSFKYDTGLLLKFPEVSLGIRDATPANTCNKTEETTPCWERILVDCHYEYKERPDLTINDCPPIPAWPELCGSERRDDGSLPVTSTQPPSPPPTPSPKPPALSTYGCYGAESHEDIVRGVVSDDASKLCGDVWNKGGSVTLDASTIAKTSNPNTRGLRANNYWYGVGWIKGCQTTSATQLLGDPLLDGNSDHKCTTLLTNCYTNCNNGGTGGWVDAGCLRYTFRASKNGLTTNWADVVKTA